MGFLANGETPIACAYVAAYFVISHALVPNPHDRTVSTLVMRTREISPTMIGPLWNQWPRVPTIFMTANLKPQSRKHTTQPTQHTSRTAGQSYLSFGVRLLFSTVARISACSFFVRAISCFYTQSSGPEDKHIKPQQQMLRGYLRIDLWRRRVGLRPGASHKDTRQRANTATGVPFQ